MQGRVEKGQLLYTVIIRKGGIIIHGNKGRYMVILKYYKNMSMFIITQWYE